MSAHGAGKAYAIGLMMGLMSKGLTYDEFIRFSRLQQQAYHRHGAPENRS